MKKISFILALLFSVSCFGQAFKYSQNAQNAYIQKENPEETYAGWMYEGGVGCNIAGFYWKVTRKFIVDSEYYYCIYFKSNSSTPDCELLETYIYGAKIYCNNRIQTSVPIINFKEEVYISELSFYYSGKPEIVLNVGKYGR